ncbi:putative germin-like protein 2-3 [Solanum stenotomum]|uniref:putative germin-like protein 2-3 n=1 Tax=Solanum stenotomum TaxID=172797 RepID=UPI0020D1A533|nr:putative germin-like protein 2-3 [Solanum stenotomum]
MANNIILMCLIFTLFCSGLAVEVGPLQDFCVADSTSMVMPSGLMCKNPLQVEANDFYYGGLNIPSNKTTPIGINMTLVNVDQLPGLNTLGISMARIDYALDGINPPHIHPRATEMLVLIEGSLHVGFVTSNPQNRLISRVIRTGDVFVFPAGLIHFQRNVGNRLAIALLSLSSQNPGLINIRDAEETLPESVKFK